MAATPEFNNDHYALEFDPKTKRLVITVDLSEQGDALPVISSSGKSVLVANSHSFQPIDPNFKVSMTVIRSVMPADRQKLQAAALGATNPGTVVP